MVLFLCTNKSSRNGMKLCKDFLYNKREFLEPGWTWGGHLGGHNPPGRAPSPGTPRWVVPTWWPRRPWNWRYKILFFQKKTGRKNYRDPWDEAAATSCSSSGGQIWSPFGAPERGPLFFVITNPSPSSIPWCSPPGVSNSFVGSLVGEELDEIHHVIKLVLLGPDP